MGIVVGEPKLKRDRKRPKDPRASYYIYWTDSIELSKEKSLRTNVYALACKRFELWKIQNIGLIETHSFSEVLIQEIMEYYEVGQIADDKDTARLQSSMKRLLPFWGSKPASVISSITVKDYVQYRFELHDELFPNAETISTNTIRRELVDLRSAVNKAYKERFIDRYIYVQLPPEIKKGVEYFSCDEAIGILRAANQVTRARDHLKLFIWIGFLTGRRKAAILELRWSDIDFETGVIYWMPEGKAETNKRRPTGKLPPRLKKILLRHRKENPNDEFVVSYQGGAIKDIKTSFNRAVVIYRERVAKTNDAQVEVVLPVAYPHMMRHSCATWLMQKSKDKREVCQFLGMTEDTLERRYWHFHPDFQRGASDAF